MVMVPLVLPFPVSWNLRHRRLVLVAAEDSTNSYHHCYPIHYSVVSSEVVIHEVVSLFLGKKEDNLEIVPVVTSMHRVDMVVDVDDDNEDIGTVEVVDTQMVTQLRALEEDSTLAVDALVHQHQQNLDTVDHAEEAEVHYFLLNIVPAAKHAVDILFDMVKNGRGKVGLDPKYCIEKSAMPFEVKTFDSEVVTLRQRIPS